MLQSPVPYRIFIRQEGYSAFRAFHLYLQSIICVRHIYNYGSDYHRCLGLINRQPDFGLSPRYSRMLLIFSSRM